MTAPISDVENKVKRAVYQKRIRAQEVFRDFDRLRTGRVTRGQFQRCVSQKIGAPLTVQELETLANHYDDRHDGTVNYRPFQQVIASVFGDDTQLDKNPTQTINTNMDFMTTKSLPEELQPHFEELLERLQKHVKYHGIDIKDAYKDFDRTKSGRVTASQFERNLPAPKDLKPEQIQLLIERYAVPDTPDGRVWVNYLEFQSEVEEQSMGSDPVRTYPRPQDGNEFLSLTMRRNNINADEIIGRLRVAFFKTRVRPMDFFKDYDRLRTSLITENQFTCGLSLACSAPEGLRLTREEIQTLANRFRGPDMKVNYVKFSKQTDQEFLSGLDGDMETNPLHEPKRFTRSEIVQDVNELEPEEEERLQSVLAGIRSQVVTRNIDVYPVFKDFDRKLGFTKGVTKSQFLRALDVLKIKPSVRDLPLLEAKYQNQRTGHVNYHAFIADIDPLSPLAPSDQLFTDPVELATITMTQRTIRDQNQPPPPPLPSLESALNQLKKRVIQRRLRVEEQFRDFDRLRTGYITEERFKQGLNVIDPLLTDPQLETLTRAYTKGQAPRTIAWREFTSDMNQLFTGANLDKNPTAYIPSLEDTHRSLMEESSTRANGLDDEALDEIEDTMEYLRQKCKQRTIDIRDIFKDADRHRKGLVSKNQFHQAMSFANFGLTERQEKLLAVFYSEGDRVKSGEFSNDLQPLIPLAAMYQKTLSDTQRAAVARSDAVLAMDEVRRDAADVENVLQKIKVKVAKHRISLLEALRDYDRLRCGRITSTMFDRGLNVSHINLTLAESRALHKHYEAPGEAGFVRYRDFCNDIETVFVTHNLEQNPTSNPSQFQPPVDLEEAKMTRKVDPSVVTVADSVLEDIAEIVRERRLEILPFFEDYDKNRRGAVSKQQFLRTVKTLQIIDGVAMKDVNDLIDKYTVPVGGREDVHYRRFYQDVSARVEDKEVERMG